MIQFFKDIYFGFLKSKTSKKILYSTFILLYLIVIIMLSVKINLEIITPGGISPTVYTNADTDVSTRLKIETNNQAGEIFTVAVHNFKKVSVFQYLISFFNNDILLYEPYNNLSDQQDEQIGVKSKDQSIINALILAYQEASKVDSSIKIDYEFSGILVTLVENYSKSDLLPDDIITHVNGEKIIILEQEETKDSEFKSNFKSLLSNYQSEDYFKLTVLRNGKEKVINTRKTKISDELKLGIYTLEWYKINSTTPKYTLSDPSRFDSIGSSGGAMLALAIYNSLLTEDITNGRRIIGTGTISVYGDVGKIGGISQKIVTANLYNPDIFFCDEGDALEAKEKAKEINAKFEIVSVKTFTDIINYLKGEVNG